VLGQRAFDGLGYSERDSKGQHLVTLPPGYVKLKARAQRKQVTKAGARLAQILTSLWP
jgi:hypothetical protein